MRDPEANIKCGRHLIFDSSKSLGATIIIVCNWFCANHDMDLGPLGIMLNYTPTLMKAVCHTCSFLHCCRNAAMKKGLSLTNHVRCTCSGWHAVCLLCSESRRYLWDKEYGQREMTILISERASSFRPVFQKHLAKHFNMAILVGWETKMEHSN